MEKDFENWHHLKVKLNKKKPHPTFQERQIWWCRIGMNVGFEIYGKSEIFTRPVLVLHKFNRYTFLGIPMSTKLKDTPYYHRLRFKGDEICAVLDQVRTFDSRRLAGLMGQLNGQEFDKIKQAYIALI